VAVIFWENLITARIKDFNLSLSRESAIRYLQCLPREDKQNEGMSDASGFNVAQNRAINPHLMFLIRAHPSHSGLMRLLSINISPAIPIATKVA
jgi:hypothetical protein